MTQIITFIYNNIFYYYQIKSILHRAEEIAISIGTGLTRIRHRSDEYSDNSRPKNNIPDWWISSNWVSPPESDDDEDNDGDNDDGNNEGANNEGNDNDDQNKDGDERGNNHDK